MGRTRLRGIELAGMRMAVESPPDFEWDWPARGLAKLACSPVESEVYVGVSIGSRAPEGWEPITYSYDRGTFDVGRVGDEWWVAVHTNGQRFARVARFDQRFSQGEITISPGAVDRVRHPLDGPLLDLLLTHRVIGDGGLVIDGTAMVERGRAIALLSSGDGGEEARSASERRIASAAGSALRTPGARFAVRERDEGLRVYGLPGGHGHPDAGVSGRLDAIHFLTRSDEVFAESIDADAAVTRLLQHACAPVHAPAMAEHLMSAANAIGSTVPMLHLGVPEERRVVPFAWGQREAALGFSLPTSG